MATSGSVQAEARRAAILSRLARTGSLELDDTAVRLGVSTMTVRRDLDALEVEGHLRRVRGGAVATAGPAPFRERRSLNAQAKRAIAAKAAALVPTAGAIAIDASTTAGLVGEKAAAQAGLTIATNAWDNFESIRKPGGATAVLVGGTREDATGSFVGPLANQGASSMIYRRFFASASALDPDHGSSEVSLAEADVKRAFASRSEDVVLCVDSSKLDHTSVAICFALTDVSVLITELDPADPRLDAFRNVVDIR